MPIINFCHFQRIPSFCLVIILSACTLHTISPSSLLYKDVAVVRKLVNNFVLSFYSSYLYLMWAKGFVDYPTSGGGGYCVLRPLDPVINISLFLFLFIFKCYFYIGPSSTSVHPCNNIFNRCEEHQVNWPIKCIWKEGTRRKLSWVKKKEANKLMKRIEYRARPIPVFVFFLS